MMQADYGRRESKFKGASGIQKGRLLGKASLVPKWLLYVAFMISFSLPNLVFSGRHWFDTLHIMKWFVTMVPIGVLSLVFGIYLLRFGAKRTGFTFDPFGLVWILLLMLVTTQPFFVNLSTITTYAKEWFYFASLLGVYLLAYNLCVDGRFHRALLWGGVVNGAVNVLFAELLIRNMNSGYPFILDVPGNYIGNTAQQEMFGLWMAMSVLNSLFLHMYYVGQPAGKLGVIKVWRYKIKIIVLINLFFLAVNSWGLWSSTARGGILSMLVAFVVLCLGLLRNGDKESLKSSLKLFGVVMLFLGLVLYISANIGTGRGIALVDKMQDMIHNPTSIGGRISIWRTSLEVFLKSPVTGVGLGQYKWNFLDGQKLMYQKYPELINSQGYEWQFTYWAHSEYIQWLCETGILGGIILLLLALWWLYRFIRSLMSGERLPPEALWGCAMAFLLWFDALFSRPFHRIENSVWMALAFAMANRSIIPEKFRRIEVDSDLIYRCFGGFVAAISLLGLVFMGGGLYGDKLIYKAVSTPGSALEKQELLQRAGRFLMSRDDAQEQLGMLYIEAGRLQEDAAIQLEGARILYMSFLKRPTSKLLFDLMNQAQLLNNTEMFQVLAKYLNPGMFGIIPSPIAISQ
ncbi:MAG: O-antigen ligase family protein [Synergistaceae bacterium]|jgi:O-antigen ligase|nr:O-antigen ligase family protein [Synergistaceae bacterium]